MKNIRTSLSVLIAGAVVLLCPFFAFADSAVQFSQTTAYNSTLGQLTFTINWNVSAATTNLVITDIVPNGTTFISASSGGTLAGNTVSWNLGSQSPGSSGSVTLTVSVDSAQNLNMWPNKVVVFSNVADSQKSLFNTDGQFAVLQPDGQITLSFPMAVLKDTGADLKIFGSGDQNQKATVEVSSDSQNWVNLGTVAGGGELKFPDGVNSVNYVRITGAASSSPENNFLLDAVLPLHKFPFACSIVNTVNSGDATNSFVYNFVSGCGSNYGSGIVSGPAEIIGPAGGGTSTPPSTSTGPSSGGGGGGSPVTTSSPPSGGGSSAPLGSGGASSPPSGTSTTSSSTPEGQGGGLPEVLGENTTLPVTGLPWTFLFLPFIAAGLSAAYLNRKIN